MKLIVDCNNIKDSMAIGLSDKIINLIKEEKLDIYVKVKVEE